MSGQVTVTIRDKQWQVSLATNRAELSTGLKGLTFIPSGTGMLFVLPQSQTVITSTRGYYFPVDIVFISSQLRVISVAFGVPPNYLVTEKSVKYFLEVNAGEVEGIGSGDVVSIGVVQAATILANINKLLSYLDITSTDGTYSLPNDVNENTAFIIALTRPTKLNSIFLDFVNLVQNVTIRVKVQIDGTNYRTIETFNWTTVMDDGVYFREITVDSNVQVTIQSAIAQGAVIAIPYRYYLEKR